MSSVLGGSFTQGLITVNGTLDLSTAVAGSIAVQPHSINLNDVGNANVYDFDPTATYSWTMISATSITGFDAGKFTIDLANFSNPGVTPGQFSVSTVGNNLVLNFGTPIPEPALLGLVAVGIFAIARRRKA